MVRVSLLARLQRLSQPAPAPRVPLVVGDDALGSVDAQLAAALAGRAALEFRRRTRDGALCLASAPRARLEARFAEVTEALDDLGVLPPRRGEAYGIRTSLRAPVRFALERAAVDVLGLPAYGTHLNGYVLREDGVHLWVATRAATKASFPGALDHVVAGGLPLGMEPRANLLKEAAEEAGLTPDDLRTVREVGRLVYACTVPTGWRRDTVLVYDVDLAPEVTPRATDGEVERFELWPLPRVLDALRGDAPFKFNVGPAILLSLLARGHLDADPECAAVRAALAH